MSNPTSNFGWQMPTPTDLVTDLPADFEVFGQAVDSSLADLKGGTSGQILSKNSNTDMDFVWITNDQGDITGVTASSPLTGGGTSGDITVGIQDASTSQKGAVQLTDSTSSTSTTTAATPNAVKTAFDLATTANTAAVTNNFYAGKNRMINASFDFWQRGTSFTLTNNSDTYTADRLIGWFNGTTNGTNVMSRQTFTVGQTDVPNNPTYFARWTATTLGSGQSVCDFRTRIENVAQFANQTVTFSFYLKSSSVISSGNLLAYATQNFGSGGSSAVDTSMSLSSTGVGTSWTRYTATATLPSITGKTVGANNYVQYFIRIAGISNGIVLDTANWQIEAGSVATNFQTATGTLQGELAACKYYYDKRGGLTGTGTILGSAMSNSAGNNAAFSFPIMMRVAPTSVDHSGLRLSDTSSGFTVSSVTLTNATSTTGNVNVATTGMTSFRGCYLDASATGNFIAFSAEL